MKNPATAHPPAILSLLGMAGLRYEPIDELHGRVGRFLFFPATKYWRSEHGDVRGYGVTTLVEHCHAAEKAAASIAGAIGKDRVQISEMMPENSIA